MVGKSLPDQKELQSPEDKPEMRPFILEKVRFTLQERQKTLRGGEEGREREIDAIIVVA